jgi:hypothetical protein
MVLLFIRPLKLIYNLNLGFIENEKCIFEQQRGSNIKNINLYYFGH